jgi:hypothetical protein
MRFSTPLVPPVRAVWPPLATALLFLASSVAAGQAQAPVAPQAASLQLHVSLPDPGGRRSGVSGVQVVFTRTDSSNFTRVETTTDAGGNAALVVIPGRYQVSTPALVHSQGKWYGWDLEVALTQPQNRVELNESNASFDAETSASEPAPTGEEGPAGDTAPANSAGTAGAVVAAAPAPTARESSPAVAGAAASPNPPAPAAAAEVRAAEPAPRKASGLGAYSTVVVGNFAISTDGSRVRDIPEDMPNRLAQSLIRRLRDRDWFPVVLDTQQSAATLQPASVPRTRLIITGEITDYKKSANIVARTLAVGFAGVPKVGATFVLRDAATGRELYHFRHSEENVDFLANQLLKEISHRR